MGTGDSHLNKRKGGSILPPRSECIFPNVLFIVHVMKQPKDAFSLTEWSQLCIFKHLFCFYFTCKLPDWFSRVKVKM